ncbi:MAG: helix-turn-helix transcriptional regulator [Paludibacteraceae bacterium]|nr:helix-turn-helix transcriptional regulator [Paludibacteraceae bacterium]
MSTGNIIKKDIIYTYGSTKKFSDITGISRTTLYDIYNNGLETASFNTITTLAKTLGYDLEKLKQGEVEVIPELLEKITMPAVTANSAFEEDILRSLRQLSIKGQIKVLDYINDLKAAYPSEVNNG